MVEQGAGALASINPLPTALISALIGNIAELSKVAGCDLTQYEGALRDPEGYLQSQLADFLKAQAEKINSLAGDMKLAVTDPKAFLEKKVCDICKDIVGRYTSCSSSVFISQIGSFCTSICAPVTAGFPPATATCIGLCTAKGFMLCKDKIKPIFTAAGKDTICTTAKMC